MSPIVLAIIVAVILLVLIVLLLLSRYRVPGAEEAFIVTGTGKGHQGKVYRGTGTFVVSEPRTVTIRVEHSHQRGDAALILDIVPQAEDDD